MKKLLLLFLMISLMGCQNEEESFYNESNITKVKSPQHYNEENTTSNSYGFVRHQKKDSTNQNKTPNINREQIADVISSLSVQLPNVEDAATLVTDAKVLIVYEASEGDRFEVADQVRKTAMSVVPSYYEIFVSDDPSLMDDLQTYSNVTSDMNNTKGKLENLINKMLLSPQGKLANDEEM
ncbi:YhcN/YlaJ family sporulation lipoprotein [Bacillus carboniphilus]|uniref:YhcN/YlaJ family sporulation lipoprotein n=1 Tax=Bacillus carboniphilus TaxID=86663 RepID=A0ABY9JPR9_9BACI|nr:YhcN/YlaJ family sporulation lipoprotein [Bacillus carboniphilus]WLR41307.1 YhcN/YlaJ family sporulation lipoprotein [Bacillus carboniphilus]